MLCLAWPCRPPTTLPHLKSGTCLWTMGPCVLAELMDCSSLEGLLFSKQQQWHLYGSHHVLQAHKDALWNGRFWIEDIKSCHGTKLNGDRLHRGPYMLKNNDIVSFGKWGFVGSVEHKHVTAMINLPHLWLSGAWKRGPVPRWLGSVCSWPGTCAV